MYFSHIVICLPSSETTLNHEITLIKSLEIESAHNIDPGLYRTKRPQAKCSPTCEMSVCGEYVYNMYVKKCHQRDGEFPPLPLSKPLP